MLTAGREGVLSLPGMDRLREGWSWLITRRCMVCARPVSGREQSKLCASCQEQLQLRRFGYCPTCGRTYAGFEATIHVCAQCVAHPPTWAGFGFFGPYSGLLRELILDFKFNGRFERRVILGNLIQAAYVFHFANDPPDGILPVPLHPKRLQDRGFNQSLELIRCMSRSTRVPRMVRALARIRKTPAQSGLQRRQRIANVRDAFQAVAAQVQGKDLLLVDDVSTTGATLSACTAALYRAGAVRVRVLVLAVVPE